MEIGKNADLCLKIGYNLLLVKRLPEGGLFLCKKYFKIFRHIRNAKIKFQNKEEKEMGDYVYGSGEVTLKKELSAVNFSQIQEGLKKKKDDLDMVELTFRIRLDATNKSSIMEINEGSDSWDEENTLEILAYLAPYITEGRLFILMKMNVSTGDMYTFLCLKNGRDRKDRLHTKRE